MSTSQKDYQLDMLRTYGDGNNTIVCMRTEANPNGCMSEVQNVKGMKCYCGYAFGIIKSNNDKEIAKL